MNNKKGKGVIGIALAAIMIASIFAVIAPTGADVHVLAGLGVVKQTYPNPSASYHVGDSVNYSIKVINLAEDCTWTGDVYDIYPNGTNVTLWSGVIIPPGGNVSKLIMDAYVVTRSDGINGSITNTILAFGSCNGEEVNSDAEEKSDVQVDKPVFNFTFRHTCCCRMEFNGSASYDPDGEIVNHTWNFSDGNITTIETAPGVVNHTFEDVPCCGNKTVTLSGYDNGGWPNSTAKTVYVPCPPTAIAEADPGVVQSGAGTEVTFSGCKSKADENAPWLSIVNYTWTFSDSHEPMYGHNVTRVVDGDPGTDICATLKVNDSHCNDTATVCVHITEKPTCKIRVYGYNNKGAGNTSVVDPETGLPPENPPYTDPIAPFYPQHEQAPEKDFVTFNPLKMESEDFDWDNNGVNDWVYQRSIKNDGVDASEKEFFRMWYEPEEWIKDENANGKMDEGDVIAPAIKQEFTFMFLNTNNLPDSAPTGTSTFLIPMASREVDNGIDSFDADDDNEPDPVVVCSEANLGDIDGIPGPEVIDIDEDEKGSGDVDWYDRATELLDEDGEELSGDESLVLRTDEIRLGVGGRIQFFDYEIVLRDVMQGPGGIFNPVADLDLYYKGNPDSQPRPPIDTINLGLGLGWAKAPFETFGMGGTGVSGPQKVGFVWLTAADPDAKTVKIIMGRKFGETWANIGANPYWNQKHFYVDGVLYNVVAIKAVGNNELKYVTFREKLPKEDVYIHQHSQELLGWGPEVILPVMPQFNMNHCIAKDVQDEWTYPRTGRPEDKIGELMDAPALDIYYNKEEDETRFHGELKEIYNETHVRKPIPICVVYGIDSSGSMAWNDPDDLRLKAAKNFTDKLDPTIDTAGVVSWDDDIDFSQLLTNDFGLVKARIGTIDSSGGTNLNVGLNESIKVMDGCSDPSAVRKIIFLSNGGGAYTNASLGGPASVAASKGYIINAIGLNIDSGTIAEANLMDMAAATGGKYYSSPSAENLTAIFEEIFEEELVRIDEFWMIEWFQTIPYNYTEFALPKEHGGYLFTSAFYAPESEWHLWDCGTELDSGTGARLKFWYDDCTGPLFIDKATESVRIYGYNNRGAGDPNACYPEKPCPENPPYTDPIAPFYPQHEQAPRKDFITFNPIKMESKDFDWDNDGVRDWVYQQSIKNDGRDASEKEFFRMWYEPEEWIKDENANGEMDEGDVIAPAIKQEFTFMFLNTNNLPDHAPTGTSKFLIPMASRVVDNGIDSFDADGNNEPDPVVVCSEANLGNFDGRPGPEVIDIDEDEKGSGDKDCYDRVTELLDEDDIELSGDESLVLRTEEIRLGVGGRIQFFDYEIVLRDVMQGSGGPLNPVADLDLYYKGNPDSQGPRKIGTINLGLGWAKAPFETYGMGGTGVSGEQKVGFVWLTAANPGDKTVKIIIGRKFGETWANIGANPYWNQKHFYVDGVLYNVVAIKTVGHNDLKYITFRVKLPKEDVYIHQHSQDLLGWDKDEKLPVMPQFNMNHCIAWDVQAEWTYDKVGELKDAPELNISYVDEDEEKRFHGELKEILGEPGWYPWCDHSDEEGWFIEHFQTIPYEYTAFKLPTGHGLYLITSAFYAPESEWHLWDCGIELDSGTGSRLKFWYDPEDNTDIYVNRLGDNPGNPDTQTMAEWYGRAMNGGNGDGIIDLDEIVNAILDYLHDEHPFGPDGPYDKDALIDYVLKYLHSI